MFIERTVIISVAVTKLTFIYWSLRLIRGSYADIFTRARCSLRATGLLNSFVFALKQCYFQSWKVF